MLTTSRGMAGAAERLVRPAWALVTVVLGAYLWLYWTPGRWALVAREVVFLLPLVCAVAALAGVVRVAPRGAERRGWGLMTMSIFLLLVSETYYASYQLFVSPGGPRGFTAYDLLNLVAAVTVVVALAVVAGAGRLHRLALLRLGSDAVAVSVVAYMLMYYGWSARDEAHAATWQVCARSAAYTFVGAAIVAGVLWLARGVRGSHDRAVLVLVTGSLVIFGVGIAASPLSMSDGTPGPNLADGIDNTVILLGYTLMFMAALTRIAMTDRGWRVTFARSINTDAAWPSTAISGMVFASCALMAVWAYRAPVGSSERLFYVAAASLAIFALVARTGFATAETGLLRDTSSTDPVTGALNHRAFQDAIEERIAASRRRHEPFALAVLDLDGFARVNSMLGHAGGDSALRSVAKALQGAAGDSGHVFRLSGDEFAVIGAGVLPAKASSFAAGLLEAVTGIEPASGLRLSASLGVVGCESCAEPRDELLRRADTAQVWAKYHGKSRVVAYDEQIVRALGVEERLRLHEEQSHLGIARALSAAADARDPSHYYHSRNVAALAVLLSEASGCDQSRVREIEIAAMLHDVGRIAMPDAQASARRPVVMETAAEQEHSVLGQRLVESLGIPGLGSWVRAHHEWWDGTGYPDGLKGEDIPLEARIIALADAYDGMTTGRRGGAPLSRSAALQEIDHGMARRFDPMLAEVFISVVGGTASLGWSDEWPTS